MNNLLILVIAVAIVFTLQGCVADRSGSRLQSSEKIAAPYESGSIFKAGINERPLYEERRARNVGDGMIMTVADNGSAAKKAASEKKAEENKTASSEKSGDDERARRRSQEGEEDLTNVSSDALQGSIPMIVTEILENGKLMLEGGKQINVDEDHKYLHVTGVVDPLHITGGNTILSTQMTNVLITIDHVRIRADGTTSRINEGNSIFGSYFQSINPR